MGRFSKKMRRENKKKKKRDRMIWNKNKKNKDKNKECKQAGCKNTAGKGTVYCGIHKPSIGSVSYKPKPQCHTGNVLVFTTPDGISVYGGGSSRQGGWWKMSPLPDLAMGPKEIVKKGNKTNTPHGWKCENEVDASIPILAIDWPDMSIPADIGKTFWNTLVEDIREKNILSISCQCMGGHGRTGVQLSILAHLLLPPEQHEWKDTHELVMWVRGRMCENEVEGKSQQEYISYVCNLPMGEPLDFHKYGGGWSASNAYTYYPPTEVEEEPDEFDGWGLFQCIHCDHEKWEKNSDDEIECDVCDDKNIVMVNITDNFYDNVVTCPRCKINTPKHAMSKTENCIACEMELLGKDCRQDGTIHCDSCKRFRPQEMFDEDTEMCVPCTKGIVETDVSKAVDTILIDDDTIDDFDDDIDARWSWGY